MTTPLERITARIAPFGDLDADTFSPKPLLTLEEFFDGNDVVGSILCNVVLDEEGYDAPTPQQVRAVLEAIRARDDVDDVRVAIGMFDDPDWPFAEEVVVVTDADPNVVLGWFPEAYAPDAVAAADDEEYEDIKYSVERFRICWWD
ncbi:hypothetical protein [Actinobaculum sp. 352]|uniref:hypothetical protein n=1 Tax=Actinobaculum sp. 352 TaxID=2490946 RepID=UPI000F7F0E79|nr:hypothetical protein [Actinobaculum sp. 352]RTE49312.1 hypothetical protein EKN07_07030 [Actinobaculum sp. 352]